MWIAVKNERRKDQVEFNLADERMVDLFIGKCFTFGDFFMIMKCVSWL